MEKKFIFLFSDSTIQQGGKSFEEDFKQKLNQQESKKESIDNEDKNDNLDKIYQSIFKEARSQVFDNNDGYTTEEKTTDQENLQESKLEAQKSVEARKSVQMQKSMNMQTSVDVQENTEVNKNLTEQKSFGNQMSIENGAEGRKSEFGRVSFACQSQVHEQKSFACQSELQEQKSIGAQQSFQQLNQQESISDENFEAHTTSMKYGDAVSREEEAIGRMGSEGSVRSHQSKQEKISGKNNKYFKFNL